MDETSLFSGDRDSNVNPEENRKTKHSYSIPSAKCRASASHQLAASPSHVDPNLQFVNINVL
jgi:hypothetical protein